MVLSSGEILTIGSGMQSQISGAVPVKSPVHQEKEEKAAEIPKSSIKYHKIRRHEKYRIRGEIPSDYISEIQVPKTNIDNLMKLTSKYKLVSFKLPDESHDYYVKSCYQIDSISSPIRNKGEGTKAVKQLLEKSLADKDTEGRIIVEVRIIDGQTSAAGFFYKLGFRFADKSKNEILNNWIRSGKSILAPKETGLMYLPKENIQKLMMYRMLL